MSRPAGEDTELDQLGEGLDWEAGYPFADRGRVASVLIELDEQGLLSYPGSFYNCACFTASHFRAGAGEVMSGLASTKSERRVKRRIPSREGITRGRKPWLQPIKKALFKRPST